MSPSPESSQPAKRRKGKIVVTPGSADGSSSKKTRSSSAGEALNKLAELRVQSYKSRARRVQDKESRGAKACIQLIKNEGHTYGSDLYDTTVTLFRDEYYCGFFLDDCTTPEVHVWYICPYYPGRKEGNMAPPPNCSGGVTGFGGWIGLGVGFGPSGGFGPGDADGADGGALC